MVHGVIFAAHDRLGVPVHSVVDVSGPHGREENHGHVRQVVAGDEEEADHIGRGLQNPVDGVECHGGPGREGAGLVVLVMKAVDVLVEHLVLVQRPMHPVHPHLHHRQVKKGESQVVRPPPDLLHVVIALSPPALHQPLGQNGEGCVQEHGRLRQLDLILDSRCAGFLKALLREEVVSVPLVDVGMPEPRSQVIKHGARHQVPHVSKEVMRPRGPQPCHHVSLHGVPEQKGIDPVVECTERIVDAVRVDEPVAP